MQLTINGENYDDLADGLSVANLLVFLNVPKGKIAVEHNLEIVPKSQYEICKLADGDKLEIIHFIGGG